MTRHRLDPVSLVFGIAFTALGVVLLDSDVDVASLSGRWLLPLPLLFAGVALAAVGIGRLRDRPSADAAPEPGEASSEPSSDRPERADPAAG